MEGEDYTYVNGEGNYKGNILLDPNGYVTRAELYDAIAEVSRPVTVNLEQTPLEVAGSLTCIGFSLLVVGLLIYSMVRAAMKRGGRR